MAGSDEDAGTVERDDAGCAEQSGADARLLRLARDFQGEPKLVAHQAGHILRQPGDQFARRVLTVANSRIGARNRVAVVTHDGAPVVSIEPFRLDVAVFGRVPGRPAASSPLVEVADAAFSFGDLPCLPGLLRHDLLGLGGLLCTRGSRHNSCAFSAICS